MARTRYTAEEIIGQLRTIEIELGKGLAVVEACRKLGITEQTYYRWKKEYGGLRVDQVSLSMSKLIAEGSMMPACREARVYLSKDHREHGAGRSTETQHHQGLKERAHFSHGLLLSYVKDSAGRAFHHRDSLELDGVRHGRRRKAHYGFCL